MPEPIVLHRGEFGRLSIRNVVGDLVTHAHRDVHIIVWLEGAIGEMTIGGRKVAPSRDFAIGVNSFEPHDHSMTADGSGGVFLAFYLAPDWVRPRYRIDPSVAIFANPLIPLEPGAYEAAVGLVESLTEGAGYDRLHHHEVEALIDQVMEAADGDRNRVAAPPRTMMARDFRIRKAIALMNANVGRRICFDEVARSVGLSRPHFFSLFREHMNVTPNVYWNMLRMEEAFRHLQNSEDRLTEIADDLGFTTQGNFSRFFREHVGVPPAVYRSAARSMEV